MSVKEESVKEKIDKIVEKANDAERLLTAEEKAKIRDLLDSESKSGCFSIVVISIGALGLLVKILS